jgi:hypothetical protein
MATRSLGTLTLDLIAKIGGFTQGMDQASRVADKRMREIERRANAFGRTIGSSIRSAGAQFLAFAGVSLTIGAAFDKIKGAIDLADETRDLSIRLGVSTEAISTLRYAAEQTGTDMDVLAKGMKILAKNAADAINPTSSQAKVFNALGISVTDAAGNLKQLDTLIPEIATKFAGMADGTTKAALAQALFGKSGLELTEFLNQGGQGLDDFRAKAERLGIVISQDTADAADKFNDDLNDLKSATGGLALQVAQALLPELDKLVTWATDFAANGDNAESAAHGIADGFRDMADAIRSLGQLADSLNWIHDFLASSDRLAAGIANFTNVGSFGAALKKNFPALYASPGGTKQSSNFDSNIVTIPGLGGPAFNATNGRFNATAGIGPTSSAVNQAKLQAALGNVSSPKTHTARGGKSDAQREAEQVARAIEQMTQAQKDWEAEVAQTGNPIADEYSDRLRQITEDGIRFGKEGVPADQVKAFTDRMTELATTLRDADVAKFQQEFDDQTAASAAQLQGPMAEAAQRYKQDLREIDDLLKKGAITQAEYNARKQEYIDERDSPATSVIAELQEQINLLGMTNEQQETYNALKAAGVQADSAYGQSIIDLTGQLQAQRDALQTQIDVMDGARDATHTFFDDLQKGEGIWHSLKDAASQFLDVLIQIGERQLIEQMFGKQGTSGAGSSGSGWLSSIFSLFSGSGSFGGEGSPLAAGGPVMPGMIHRVGEYDRPEVLMRGGKSWLLPGERGRVVPLNGAGGGPASAPVTIQFIQRERFGRETGTQAGQKAATALRMGRRND